MFAIHIKLNTNLNIYSLYIINKYMHAVLLTNIDPALKLIIKILIESCCITVRRLPQENVSKNKKGVRFNSARLHNCNQTFSQGQ